jgi:hypothetical protein
MIIFALWLHILFKFITYPFCRVILLHTIGKDYKRFAGLHGINYTAVHNFVKWSYDDYINNRDKSKQFRYLSTDNCIRILELSGYEIRLSLVLKNDTEI